MTRTRITTTARIRNTALLGLAGIGAAGAIALGPTHNAQAAEPVPVNPAAAPATQTQLTGYDGALQPNGYYCGPAATRIALSAHEPAPTFDRLADEMGTTRDGTRSIDDITGVLNQHRGEGRYTSVKLDTPTVTPEQTETLRTDVMAAITDGDPIVANIVGQVTDTDGETHRYPGGHYVTITGYSDNGHTVTVTDPADRKGDNEYRLPIDEMAGWMATRGYAS
jgi:hypothetical protein